MGRNCFLFSNTWVHPRFLLGFAWIVICPFVHLFFWPLCFLFFFGIRILIAHLISSNSLYSRWLLWYGIIHVTYHINPWDNMGFSGWYDMWYEQCRIIIYDYYICLLFVDYAVMNCISLLYALPDVTSTNLQLEIT